MMKVWITKYALTSGIKEIECEDCENGAVKEIENPLPTFYHGEGKEWHRTKESAIQKAEEMRQKKIASLKKQIEKLEEMRFE